MILLECKSIIIYLKRYVLLPLAGLYFVYVISEGFVKELSLVIASFYAVNQLFVAFEEYVSLFMFDKLRFFLLRLTTVLLLGMLFGKVYVFVASIVLVISVIQRRMNVLGIMIYFYMRSQEVELIESLYRYEFQNDKLYVIVFMVFLSCVSVIVYMSKDIENN